MLTARNLKKLRLKLRGHFAEVAKRVKPEAVTKEYVSQVLRGVRVNQNVINAAIELAEELDQAANKINEKVLQLK